MDPGPELLTLCLSRQQQCHHSGFHENQGEGHNLIITKLGKLGRVVECQSVYFYFQGYRHASGFFTVCGPDASCSMTADPNTSRGRRRLKDSVVDWKSMDTGSCGWKCKSFPPTASPSHSTGLHEVVSPCGVWILNLRCVCELINKAFSRQYEYQWTSTR